MTDKALKTPRVVAIIQVRMGSTRLPGKSLLDICGKPLLLHVIERIAAARCVREVAIATTTDPQDRALLELGSAHGIRGYAGSADDVLDRYYQAARTFQADIIVRVTADDPFKDPGVTDRIVQCLLDDPGLCYASNTVKPTFPEGIDIEAFTFAAIERAWREAKLPSEREHVTPYIWKNPDKFRVLNVENDEDLSRLRWTIDYEADLEFARAVYAALYKGQVFGMSEIVAFLRSHPEIAAINDDVVRNEGYAWSLEQDRSGLNNQQP